MAPHRPRLASPHHTPSHLLLALRIAAEINHTPDLSAHTRDLTLTLIEVLKTTDARRRSEADWAGEVHRALAPLCTISAAWRWLDLDLYQRWYQSTRPRSALAPRCYALTQGHSLPQLQHTATHDQDADVRSAAYRIGDAIAVRD